MADFRFSGVRSGLGIASLILASCAAGLKGGTTTQATVTIPGTSAIALAGRTDVTIPAPGASLPTGYPLIRNSPAGPYAETFPVRVSAASGATFQFSGASGAVNYNYTNTFDVPGPDGENFQTSVLNSVGGISGYDGPVGALVGVFLTNSDPQNATPPATLNFSSSGSTTFSSLSPALGQVFYIGDGLTGTGNGSEQTFIAPAGATQLYLGVPDGHLFQGAPGDYDDNTGAFSVTINATGVPEPSMCGLLLAAAVVGLGLRRRIAN